MKKEIFSGYLVSITNILILLISYPKYINHLGLELFGLWVSISVILFFGQMGQLGINTSIIKFVSESKIKSKLIVTEYVTAGFIYLVILSFIFILFIVILNNHLIEFFNIADNYQLIVKTSFFYFIFLFPSIMFVQFYKGILMGLGKIKLSNYLIIVNDILRVSLSLFFLNYNYGINSLIFGWLIPNITFIILFHILYIKEIKEYSFWNNNFKIRFIEIFHYGKHILGSRVINIMFIPLTNLIIASFVGLSAVTYFDISWKIIVKIRTIFEQGTKSLIVHSSKLKLVINQTLFKNSIISLLKTSTKFIFYTSLPIFLIFPIFIKFFLKYWLNDLYSVQILYATNILFIGLIFQISSLSIYNIMLGINKQKYIFYSALFKVIIFTLCNVVFIFFDKISFIFIISSISLSIAFQIILLLLLFYNFINKIEVKSNR